jgi:GTP-binding protein
MKLNLNRTSLKISAGTVAQFPKEIRLQIALSGRSNVGKSSLINTLVGQKSLARVSSTPGKTITINFYNLDETIYLVDLPGYGYAKRSGESKTVWSNLTDSYFTKNPVRDLLKLVIQLIDVRVGPTDDDIMMINYLIDSGIPFTVVATKTDKLSKTALANRLEELHHEYFEGTDIEILPFSSVTKAGREELWSVITRAALGE